MTQTQPSAWEGSVREVSLDLAGTRLEGTLALPEQANGLVLFAHGSGSSRHSPRNQYVAQTLQRNRLGTLLFDLLTKQEERLDQSTGELRFDIPFLAQRLIQATEWAARWAVNEINTAGLKLGYFGASTGAGAALMAAAELGSAIHAVVSRGGRPDLAAGALAAVRAPTLLIVGGKDEPVIRMNREAMEKLGSPQKQLIIVPGATHLFEEAGAIEEVARLAAQWFVAHFDPGSPMLGR